jgi:hypothetical protein
MEALLNTYANVFMSSFRGLPAMLLTHCRWSDDLLRLFLQSRNVPVPESPVDRKVLIDLVITSATLPIVPMKRTPASTLGLLTLQQLGYYLKEKRGHPINANSTWLRCAPPKMGRIKRNALRDFALTEYETLIAPDERELDLYDQNIADTLRQDITIVVEPSEDDDPNDERFGIMGVYLLDDDIE